MLGLMLEHHPHGLLADLYWVLASSSHRPILSGVGASNIPGAVQLEPPTFPGWFTWDVLGSLSLDLEQVSAHARNAKDRGLLSNPVRRYAEIGYLGELILELEESLDRLPRNP